MANRWNYDVSNIPYNRPIIVAFIYEEERAIRTVEKSAVDNRYTYLGLTTKLPNEFIIYAWKKALPPRPQEEHTRRVLENAVESIREFNSTLEIAQNEVSRFAEIYNQPIVAGPQLRTNGNTPVSVESLMNTNNLSRTEAERVYGMFERDRLPDRYIPQLRYGEFDTILETAMNRYTWSPMQTIQTSTHPDIFST